MSPINWNVGLIAALVLYCGNVSAQAEIKMQSQALYEGIPEACYTVAVSWTPGKITPASQTSAIDNESRLTREILQAIDPILESFEIPILSCANSSHLTTANFTVDVRVIGHAATSNAGLLDVRIKLTDKVRSIRTNNTADVNIASTWFSNSGLKIRNINKQAVAIVRKHLSWMATEFRKVNNA